MRVILEIEPGSVAPRSITIEAGSELRVGRMAPAQVVLNDRTVSRQHFAIAFDGRSCRARDLGSSHGTMVNGQPISQAVLHDGDMIRAGMTTMRVRFVEESASPAVGRPLGPAEPVPSTAAGTVELPALDLSLHGLVLRELRSREKPLFAILDAARDPLILARLLDCKEEHQSLYEGIEGDRLRAFAPYLVSLPHGSSFLETIVRDGWGKSWGIYLTSEKPFKEVRDHLRHFLMVQLEGDQQVYFRFYDPRVLRVFLPTCTPRELTAFFGPIQDFLLESGDVGTLLQFASRAGKLERQESRLNGPNGR